MNLSDLQTASSTKNIVSTVYQTTANSFTALLATWQSSVDLIWDSGKPAEVLADMGTNAALMLNISQLTSTFLETVSPGCCADRLAKIQNCIANPDGTVTLLGEIVTPPEEVVTPPEVI